MHALTGYGYGGGRLWRGTVAQSVRASALYAKGPGFNLGLSQATFGKKWYFQVNYMFTPFALWARMTTLNGGAVWLTSSPDAKERQ